MGRKEKAVKLIFAVTNDLNYDQRMLRICTSLQQAGYEVTLVGRQRRGSAPLSERPYRQHRLSCFFQRGKLFYLEYNLRLLLFLLFGSFEVICAVDLDTIAPAYLISRIKAKKLVFDAHEYFSEVPEVVDRPFTRWVWETLAGLTIPHISNAYTVSRGLADQFQARYGINFEIIRNVPYRSEPRENFTPASKPIVLYQGALNEGRGIAEAIRAVKELPEVELWLAGEGDLSQALRDLVTALQLQDRVRFVGYLRPEELKKLTPTAAIGLNLLENKGLSYYYSLANKFFDYIQAGVPSINMNFPEYMHINRQYEVGILVEDLKQDTIQAAIRSLLTNPALYQRLKENCRQAALELCWEVEEKRLTQFYGKLVA